MHILLPVKILEVLAEELNYFGTIILLRNSLNMFIWYFNGSFNR